jgi:hypothetical protein
VICEKEEEEGRPEEESSEERRLGSRAAVRPVESSMEDAKAVREVGEGGWVRRVE